MVRGGRCGPGVAHQTLVPLLGGPSGTRMGLRLAEQDGLSSGRCGYRIGVVAVGVVEGLEIVGD